MVKKGHMQLAVMVGEKRERWTWRFVTGEVHRLEKRVILRLPAWGTVGQTNGTSVVCLTLPSL